MANGQPVVSDIDDRLYEHIYYERCMLYWERKDRINPGQGDRISWKNYKAAIRRTYGGQRQWVYKHYCGFEGTNYMLCKQGARTTAICPNCTEVETHRRVTQCQSNQATAAYRNIEHNFKSWLKSTTSGEI